jgi:hypothetical protein
LRITLSLMDVILPRPRQFGLDGAVRGRVVRR